jgi:hypothetical protein
VKWQASICLYILLACVCAWSFSNHAVPHKRKIVRYGGAFLFFVGIMAVGSYGTWNQYRREHPLAVMKPTSKVHDAQPPLGEAQRPKNAQPSPITGEPNSVLQNHNRPKSQPPAKPEVIDFYSTNHVVLSNNSNESIFVLNLVATPTSFFLPGSQSASYPLDVEIGPKKTQEVKVGPQESWDTIPPTTSTLQQQWSIALETYKSCARAVYFSPSNAGLKQIQDHYRAYAVAYPVGEASGTISYRTNNTPTVMEDSFPLKVILVKLIGCQH